MATGYHLGFVARYLRETTASTRSTWNIYASLSEGAEMLFLFAFAFGKAFSRRHGPFCLPGGAGLPNDRLLAPRWLLPSLACARHCWYLPVRSSGIDATSAYNDVALACVAFTLFYLLQLWDAERTTRLLLLIGLVAGFGYAVKYTACLGVLYAIGFVAWKSRRSGECGRLELWQRARR